MGHGVASAWGPHRHQVLGVPISASRCIFGGLKLCAVGGGSIHRLSCTLLGRRMALSPLRPSRRTANNVGPGIWGTCFGGWWWAWFLLGGLCGSGCLSVLQKRFYALRMSSYDGCGRSPLVAAFLMWFSTSTLSGQPRCCRKGTWWRARIRFGVTVTKCSVVPEWSRVVVVTGALGPVLWHRWFVVMT